MTIRSYLMATFYDSAMKQAEARLLYPYRLKLLNTLEGRVLEIGSGTGINIPFYQNIDRLICSEPDANMRRHLKKKIEAHDGFPIELLESSAEKIGVEDASIDVVVSTLVMCSVKDQAQVLSEIKRVLKPGGKLVFLEHVCSHDKKTEKWQARVTPTWSYLFDNCHLNRLTAKAIEDAGFDIEIEHIQFKQLFALLSTWIAGVGRVKAI